MPYVVVCSYKALCFIVAMLYLCIFVICPIVLYCGSPPVFFASSFLFLIFMIKKLNYFAYSKISSTFAVYFWRNI